MSNQTNSDEVALGTIGVEVEQDDVFQDVYLRFFDLYNDGHSPKFSTEAVMDEFRDALSDTDDGQVALLALALAQWETQALDLDVLTNVTQVIKSGHNLANWAQRGASPADIDRRRLALDNFLLKIGTARPFKKRRTRRNKTEILERSLVQLEAPDGQKRLSVTEVFWDGTYVHTSGVIIWSMGGGGIFHIKRPDLRVAAKWQAPDRLEIRFAGLEKGDVQFGAGKECEAFFLGDRVSLSYFFD